jgi:hypothetical protein
MRLLSFLVLWNHTGTDDVSSSFRGDPTLTCKSIMQDWSEKVNGVAEIQEKV